MKLTKPSILELRSLSLVLGEHRGDRVRRLMARPDGMPLPRTVQPSRQFAWSVWLFLTLAGPGCVGEVRYINGDVVDDAGRPVAGCDITIEVKGSSGEPERALRVSRTSDSEGKFSFGSISTVSQSCVIRAEKAGFASWTLPCPEAATTHLHIKLQAQHPAERAPATD
jgi:hypothetical protein